MSDMEDFIDVKVTRRGRQVAEGCYKLPVTIDRSEHNSVRIGHSPQRVDGIMVMTAFAGVCPGDDKEVKAAVGPMSPLGATAKQPDLLRIEVSHKSPQHFAESFRLRSERSSVRSRERRAV
jgi:hypothetical protein